MIKLAQRKTLQFFLCEVELVSNPTVLILLPIDLTTYIEIYIITYIIQQYHQLSLPFNLTKIWN